MGVADHEFGWGAVASDFDNDGWVDLYYTGKSQALDLCAAPGNLFMNEGGTFSAPTVPIDLTDQFTTAVARGDFDGNGFEDIIIATTEVIPLAMLETFEVATFRLACASVSPGTAATLARNALTSLIVISSRTDPFSARSSRFSSSSARSSLMSISSCGASNTLSM